MILMRSLSHTVQYVRQKKTHQVEVIGLFLAKLATLSILSKSLKNFPIQLINPLSDSSCKDFAIRLHSRNGTITV